MTTYEKIVKGATKVKVAAPKSKYIEPILLATSVHHPTEVENFNTIMRSLHTRLRDSAWSVVYKALIVIHIMIREGDKDFTLKYIGEKMPNLLQLDMSSVARGSGMTSDVKFIMKYAKYLQTRVGQFLATRVDYVRDERSNNTTDQTGGRLRFLSVEKGLLRESESVQKQIDGLLKNNFMENDINNVVLLTSFRLLVNDLLALFQELNEGVINLLEHYFEMSKVDAERALKIYKKFVDQTKYVIDYLRVAKHLEHATKLHVPTIKHAPTALTSSLEEYLDDPNFEDNRRQYLLEKNLKSGSPSKVPSILQKQDQNGQSGQNGQQLGQNGQNGQQGQQVNQYGQSAAETNRANSLVIQQSNYNPWDQQMTGQLQGQPQGQQVFHAGGVFTMPPIAQGQTFASNSPFQQPPQQQQQIPQFTQQPVQAPVQQPVQQHSQINPVFTGAGFGGYGQQPQQPQIVQQTGTNPFLQPSVTGQQPQTQPFAPQQTQQSAPQQTQQLAPQQTQQFQVHQQFTQSQPSQAPQPIGLQRTNTNPFAMNQTVSTTNTGLSASNPFGNSRFAQGSGTTALSFNNQETAPAPIKASATGSNPFKVSDSTASVFTNAAQQKPQPLKPQATAGGLENLPTIPIFPETQKEQQKQQYLSNAHTGLQQQSTQQFGQFQQQQQPQTTQFPIQQQSTQQFQQPQQQQPQQQFQQQQPPQQFPLQQQPTQPFYQVQPQSTQQFPFQQQNLYANNTYNGPSLI